MDSKNQTQKREIKFRAWHIKEEKMCSIDVLTDKGAFLIGVKKAEDQYGDKWYIYSPDNGRFCENEEIKLMQFTGLHDKNGKEIYEGDIVKYGTDEPNPVIFDNQMFCVPVGGSEHKTHLHIMGGYNKWEVIGNIYENPELLKS